MNGVQKMLPWNWGGDTSTKKNHKYQSKLLSNAEIEILQHGSVENAWMLCKSHLSRMLDEHTGDVSVGIEDVNQASDISIGCLLGESSSIGDGAPQTVNLGLVDDHEPRWTPRFFSRIMPGKGHSPILQPNIENEKICATLSLHLNDYNRDFVILFKTGPIERSKLTKQITDFPLRPRSAVRSGDSINLVTDVYTATDVELTLLHAGKENVLKKKSMNIAYGKQNLMVANSFINPTGKNLHRGDGVLRKSLNLTKRTAAATLDIALRSGEVAVRSGARISNNLSGYTSKLYQSSSEFVRTKEMVFTLAWMFVVGTCLFNSVQQGIEALIVVCFASLLLGKISGSLSSYYALYGSSLALVQAFGADAATFAILAVMVAQFVLSLHIPNRIMAMMRAAVSV